MQVEPAVKGAVAADDAEDTSLASLSLPASHLRRIARSAAPPGTRFSAEAIAAMQRVAQVYVLWATDQSLKLARGEVDRQQKRGKPTSGASGASRKLNSEHVMRFLSAQLPEIASEIAKLMPDKVPMEFRPPAVLLLNQLEEQRVQRRTQKAAEEARQMPHEEADASAAPRVTGEAAQVAAAMAPTGNKRLREESGVTKLGGAQKSSKKDKKNGPSLASFFGKPSATPPAVSEPQGALEASARDQLLAGPSPPPPRGEEAGKAESTTKALELPAEPTPSIAAHDEEMNSQNNMSLKSFFSKPAPPLNVAAGHQGALETTAKENLLDEQSPPIASHEEEAEMVATASELLAEPSWGKLIIKTEGEYKLRAGTSTTEGMYSFDLQTGVLNVSGHQVGRFSCDPISAEPLLVDFDSDADATIPCISIENSEVMAEIQNAANVGAYFVLPSQLNGAEYPSHTKIVTSVEDYKSDNTGGPRGQLAVHPAAAQFVLDNAANQDRKDSGINAIDVILKTVEGFELRNGYLKLPMPSSHDQADSMLQAFIAKLHTLRPLVMSEVQASGLTANKKEFSGTGHSVNLVYASAVPINAYLNKAQTPAQERLHGKVAEAILIAQYYGSLRVAANAAKHGRTKVFLMPLGGGVFNNSWDSIGKSMALAVEMLTLDERNRLDIKALSWKGNPSEKEQLTYILGHRHNKLVTHAHDTKMECDSQMTQPALELLGEETQPASFV